MPINCHTAALVTVHGDWSLMRLTSLIRRKLKKQSDHVCIIMKGRVFGKQIFVYWKTEIRNCFNNARNSR